MSKGDSSNQTSAHPYAKEVKAVAAHAKIINFTVVNIIVSLSQTSAHPYPYRRLRLWRVPWWRATTMAA